MEISIFFFSPPINDRQLCLFKDDENWEVCYKFPHWRGNDVTIIHSDWIPPKKKRTWALIWYERCVILGVWATTSIIVNLGNSWKIARVWRWLSLTDNPMHKNALGTSLHVNAPSPWQTLLWFFVRSCQVHICMWLYLIL